MRFILILALMVASCDTTDFPEDPPPGDPPHEKDIIVFSAKDENNAFQIFTIRPDGSALQKLTNFSEDEEGLYPNWKPDGSKIIFSSWKEGTSTGPALWTMGRDGTDLKVLFDLEPDNPHVPPLAGNYPQWSLDGKKVLFDLCLGCSAGTNNDIFVFDTQTQETVRLTDQPIDLPGAHFKPAWHPQGSQISFISESQRLPGDTTGFRQTLQIMQADGSMVRSVPHPGSVRDYVWGPTPGKITYVPSTGTLSQKIVEFDMLTGAENHVLDFLSDEFAWLPLTWHEDGEYLLVVSTSKAFRPISRLIIVDVKRQETKVLFSKRAPNVNPVISGADWITVPPPFAP